MNANRMTVGWKTQSYNDSRYGRPWIARLDFASDRKGTPAWGDWIGSPGSEGLLEVQAAEGDVVMWGQKDFRKPRNSAASYGVVCADGSVDVMTKAAAVLRHRELRLRVGIVSEVERLMELEATCAS